MYQCVSAGRSGKMGAMERYVTLRGLRLYVREQGDGHPLLLINGLGGHADMWGPAEDRLSETSRTIVFDAPGTGRSSTSPFPIPLPVVAKLLVRLLDELGHERVDVAGYSLGGVMAQQFARTAPDRVRRLALVVDQLRLGQRAAGSRVAGADLDPCALPLAAALQGHQPPAGRRRPVPRPEPQTRPGRAPQPPSAVVRRLRAAVPPGLDVVEPALVLPADDADARDRRHPRPAGAGRQLACCSPTGSRTAACTCCRTRAT